MSLTDLYTPNPAASLPGNPFSGANPINWISQGRNYADTLANNFILKPATANGIGGFVFDVAGETALTADMDITEYYTEYNNFFQDHAALRPLEITLRGFASELVLPAPQGVSGVLSTLQNKLTQLPALLGKYTPQALGKVQAVVTKSQNVVNQIDNVIGRVKNIAGLIVGGSAANSKQSLVFSKLMAMRDSRQVFTMVSPWGMVGFWDPIQKKGGPRSFIIRRIVFEQPEDTKDRTDVVVTVKEVRFATVTSQGQGQTAQEAAQNNSGIAQQRMQGQTNKGQQTQTSTTAFSTLFSSFGNVKQVPIGA